MRGSGVTSVGGGTSSSSSSSTFPSSPNSPQQANHDKEKINPADRFEHSMLFRETKEDVFDKYELVDVLGTGSMGAVAKVRIKPNKVGGSAFVRKTRGGIFGWGLLGKSKSIPTGHSLQKQSNVGEHLYALKSIQLDRVSDMFIDELRNEVSILKRMDHPNIVKAHELYFYQHQIYVVLELCDGGDLYTRSPYSERESCHLVQQIVSAVRYMHEHKIVHRDLKFEVGSPFFYIYISIIPYIICVFSTHFFGFYFPYIFVSD
jgi:serine/threonine protein kinase